MAGRINGVSTPQFDAKQPQTLQTWATQVRDSLNPAVDLVNSVADGTAALVVASVTTDTLTTGVLAATSGFRYCALALTQDQTTIAGASTVFPTVLTGTAQLRMPYAGTIVAISARVNNNAITAGTLTFAARVNATSDTQTIAITTAVNGASLILPLPVAFTAGQAIAISVTSTGYTGTANSTVTAGLWVVT